MIQHFPFEHTLDSGTKVVINKTGNNTYQFSLTPTKGTARQFTYVEGEKTKAQWDEELDFEELNALRAFWLLNNEDH